MSVKEKLTGSCLGPKIPHSIIPQQRGNYIFMHGVDERHESAVKLLCNVIYRSGINIHQWHDVCKNIHQRLVEGKEDPWLIVHSSIHQVVK